MPHIEVTWAREELSLFTPASAPVLPYSVLTQYEASVAAAQRTSPTETSLTTNTPTETATANDSAGLTTAARAGIGK